MDDKCSEELPNNHAETIKKAFNCDFRSLRAAMNAVTWGTTAIIIINNSFLQLSLIMK